MARQRLLKTVSPRTNNFLELPKSAPITGQLEVRLMGCQDLLDVVPDRQKRDTFTIPVTVDKTPKSLRGSTSSSSKTYTFRGSELSSKKVNISLSILDLR